VEIVYKPRRKGEVLRNSSEITKAKTLLDFHPTVDLDRGLEQTFSWFADIERAKAS
jgi:nucleoside-diphosphate-sugar epimerase